MKKLEEQMGNLTLIESNLSSKIEKLPLTEAQKGKYFGAWKCPIWQIGKLNLNGRVYPLELANKIIESNLVTAVCDGHDPDYHREYKNYIAVAKEPWLDGSVFGCNVYIIDAEYQDTISKLESLGLPIGVSSVGYGETDQDGVINYLTYELIRYLDFVTFPASQVFAKPIEKESNSPALAKGEDNKKSADLNKLRIEALAELNKLLSMED